MVEDEKAVEVVVRLEEAENGLGRQLTVRKVRTAAASDTASELEDMSVVGEPVQSGLQTPTRKAEGIAAFDFEDSQRLHVNQNPFLDPSAASSTESFASERHVSSQRLL